MLADHEGCCNIRDEIIIFGRSKEEHDQRLSAVLKRLEESGLTVNEDKCEFMKHSLEFFGPEFPKDGVSMQAIKHDSITRAEGSKSFGEIRSLLG